MPVLAQASVRFGEPISYTKTLMGTIQSATMTDLAGNVMPLSGVTNSSATLPSVQVDGQKSLIGINTLRVNDGTRTSSTLVTVLPPEDFGYVTLLGGFLTTPDSFTELFDTAGVGDQFLYRTDEVTLLSDGTVLAVNENDNTIIKIGYNDGVSVTGVIPVEIEEMVMCLPWRVGTKNFKVCRRITSRGGIKARKFTNYVYK